MKLRVFHRTRYDYAQEVSFSPHTLYLRPREQAAQRLLGFSLELEPSARIVWTRDPQDNPLALAWFGDRAAALSIRTEFTVETLATNPFDFLLQREAVRLPFAYAPAEQFMLGPCLAPPFGETQRVLCGWLDRHFRKRPEATVPFLSALNTFIFESLSYRRRDERGIQPSAHTVASGTGSCRDYALLFIELCRTLGLAARFVSGYLYDPPEAAGASPRAGGTMHAWAEVYLPGAGWRGLDPTHGVWCTDAHIPVAVAALAETVNPIQGAYAAPQPVYATMHTEVLVEKIG
jgi:transglutaminase-like putative cysteine protease